MTKSPRFFGDQAISETLSDTETMFSMFNWNSAPVTAEVLDRINICPKCGRYGIFRKQEGGKMVRKLRCQMCGQRVVGIFKPKKEGGPNENRESEEPWLPPG